MYKCDPDMIRPIGTVVLYLATRWLPHPKPYIETDVITLFMQKATAGIISSVIQQIHSKFSHTCCWPCDEGSYHD